MLGKEIAGLKRWVIRVFKETKVVGKRGFGGFSVDWEVGIEIAEKGL